jgi:hypothetical protein
LKDDDLDQIVLHEYAHLRRRDDWTRLAQALVRAVVGFHPAVLWIGRRLDLEREAACDDFVVRRTGAARRYAACLTHAAELAYDAGAGSGPALAPGAAGATRDLAVRVVRLLDGRARVRRLGQSATALAAGNGILGAGVTLCVHATPLVAVAAPVAVVVPASPLAAALPAPAAPIAGWDVVVPLPPAAVRAPAAHRRPAPASLSLRPVPGTAFQVPGVPIPAPPAPAAVPATAGMLAAVPFTGRVVAPAAVAAPTGGAPADAGVDAGRGPWLGVVDAGTAVGAGVKKASVATAGFFTRLGRSVASAF